METKKLHEEYQLLSQEEQILLRPDTMIGAIEEQTKYVWAFNYDTNKIEKQSLTYIPGALKLFDEILTNASDHAQRNKGVTTIKVNISEDWKVTVWNDGDGIPVEKHKVHNIYIPEMVLGRLNSGSNYNDKEERYGAGRNGVGSGLVALFSSYFSIDCADGKKSYYQEITNNAKTKTEPIIKSTKKSYTCVSYITDFNRLPIEPYKDAMMRLCTKRVYDIAVYNPNIKVYFNDQLIKVNNIKDWCQLHVDEDNEIFIETIDKWTVAVAESNTDSFEQCSIVNGNTTWVGGTHVEYIMNQIVKRLTEDLTKGKKGIKIKPAEIRNKFHLFLVTKIANPIFDSQTKENLSSKLKEKIELTDKFYKALLKSNIIKSILEWVQLREQAELNKLNTKAAGKTLRIEKLSDAHKAGTVKSKDCILAIAEGDSAAGSVMAGLNIVGRDYWGVFPVKGRPLNVRDVPVSKIIENDEISKIIKIIGLVPGKKYTDLSELRYGKIVFFTDADSFGISIKGLLINLFHKMWPELLSLGFCYEFITPIIKATKGKIVKDYYDLEKYKKDNNENKLDGYKIKYFKGLGTITAEQMKEMFKNIDKHLIPFIYDDKRDNDKIDLVFNKKRADERKDWMLNYKGEIMPDKLGKPNQINDFIDNEFIQFSNYDNVISIPELMDGFKISQRKIMYGAFKRNLKEEVKVAQLGGYVAEHTHFAHGENNLFGTTINMAQDFVGANNINLFIPKGNFGSRRDPNSAASPRYIYTYLNPITEYLFRKEDETVLEYLQEEGTKIEPKFYLPIIPTILVNGTSGIGTGWSTDIPKYDPLALIEVIKRKLKKSDLKYAINPQYKGWNGNYEFDDTKNTYVTYGVLKLATNKKSVNISELPVDISIDKYISILDKLQDDKKIKKYTDNSTDIKIDINVELIENTKIDDLYKYLKLTNNISINNMVTWYNGQLRRWNNAEELLNTWFDERLKWYEKRKIEWSNLLQKKYKKSYYLYQFIKGIVNDKLIINKRKIQDVINELEEIGFEKYNDSYDYLLNIPASSFTEEKVNYYKEQAKNHKEELETFSKLTIEELWTNELIDLEKQLKKAGY